MILTSSGAPPSTDIWSCAISSSKVWSFFTSNKKSTNPLSSNLMPVTSMEYPVTVFATVGMVVGSSIGNGVCVAIAVGLGFGVCVGRSTTVGITVEVGFSTSIVGVGNGASVFKT